LLISTILAFFENRGDYSQDQMETNWIYYVIFTEKKPTCYK